MWNTNGTYLFYVFHKNDLMFVAIEMYLCSNFGKFIKITRQPILIEISYLRFIFDGYQLINK